jgi:enamine deaminase RidA (YjgF/YER057c/UK114 family)
MAIERFQTGARMSQAVVHGNTVYLAGQVADNLVPSVAEQTRQVLAKIDALLRSAGSDKSRILSANVWLADMGRFAEMNEVWDSWVVQGHTPARATVGAALARPEYLVEIMVVAARD